MVDLTLPDVALAQGDVGRRLAERVCAWQHRQPLARRIVPGEVAGWGVIALPYGEAGPGGEPTPLFHQPSLLPGLPHRALVDFAAHHGVDQRPGPADWPQRDIERADAVAEPAPITRYLLTAAITDPRSATPRRLLLAPAGPAIWGARPPDRVRLAVAALLATVLLALAAWGLVQATRQSAVVPLVPATSAASPVQPASAPAFSSSAPVVASSAPAVPSSASGLTIASPPLAAVRASAAPAPSVPVGVSPATPAPRLAAQPASASALPAAKASAPALLAPASAASTVPVQPPRLLPMPNTRGPSAATSAVAPASASAAPVPTGPHYALVSVPTRKRADAEVMLQRVRQLLGPAIGALQAQVMPSPQGFVVTLWPLPTQGDAEQLAEVLGRRGVPMKWMEF